MLLGPVSALDSLAVARVKTIVAYAAVSAPVIVPTRRGAVSGTGGAQKARRLANVMPTP